MSGHVSLLVIDLATTEFSERVVNSVASDHLDNLRILFIETDALLPLEVIVEHVSHLNSRAFLSCYGFRASAILVKHHSVQEVSDEGQL